MATTNYSWNLPTVGGSEDTWGAQLNANWTALDTLLGGTSKAQFDTLRGVNVAGGFALVPSGGIIMWSGSIASIPSGWLLCDGTNGTPDLRDRFVVGAGDNYAVDATGGADNVALSISEMPVHNHTATSAGAGAHSHTFSGTTGTESVGHTHTFSATTSAAGAHDHALRGGFGTVEDFYGGSTQNYGVGIGSEDVNYRTGSVGNHTHTVSGTTSNISANHTHAYSGTTSAVSDHTHSISVDSSGSGAAHENRPPYYALAFIMKA